MFDEESEDDVEEHDRYRRDVTISCCDTDFCNMPLKTTTTTLPPTSPGPFPHGNFYKFKDSVGFFKFFNTFHCVLYIDIPMKSNMNDK